MQRPIFLSGKVVMEDGTPPPDSVVIERICNGRVRPEAYTDSKGRFSFQLGQNMSMMQDASVSSADAGFGGANVPGQRGSMGGFGGMNRGISEQELNGCELRASLAGFRSEVVQLTGRRMFDNPDVGTIILRRLGNVEGTTISMTSLQAPKDAKKAYEKGRDILRKNKKDDPKKMEQALKEFALAADSKYVSPYLQMALLSAKENKWQDVADTTERVIKLNPVDFPHAFFYNSVANYNLRKMDVAEQSAREAVKLDTGHRIPKAQHLLGMILADKRDYTGAAENLRGYLKFAPQAGDADTVRQQLSELEKLTGGAAKVTEQNTQP
jgi:hypothetical protein